MQGVKAGLVEPLPAAVALQHAVVPLARPTAVAVGLLTVHLMATIPVQGAQMVGQLLLIVNLVVVSGGVAAPLCTGLAWRRHLKCGDDRHDGGGLLGRAVTGSGLLLCGVRLWGAATRALPLAVRLRVARTDTGLQTILVIALLTVVTQHDLIAVCGLGTLADGTQLVRLGNFEVAKILEQRPMGSVVCKLHQALPVDIVDLHGAHTTLLQD